jgi:hypothetical protein
MCRARYVWPSSWLVGTGLAGVHAVPGVGGAERAADRDLIAGRRLADDGQLLRRRGRLLHTIDAVPGRIRAGDRAGDRLLGLQRGRLSAFRNAATDGEGAGGRGAEGEDGAGDQQGRDGFGQRTASRFSKPQWLKSDSIMVYLHRYVKSAAEGCALGY